MLAQLQLHLPGPRPVSRTEGTSIARTKRKDTYECVPTRARRVQIRNGSFNLHAAMDGGVHLRSAQHGWEQLQLAAMDTALVAVGDPEVLPDTRGPARPDRGLAFNLLNNAWGTNYVMWTPYGDGVGSSIKSRCAPRAGRAETRESVCVRQATEPEAVPVEEQRRC